MQNELRFTRFNNPHRVFTYFNMQLFQTQITPFINESIHVDIRTQNFLSSPFHSQPTYHAHPELELVFIQEGFGKRIINNKIDSFGPGDMVFIGSNVSHVWLSDPIFYEKDSLLKSKVIVTYFNHKLFDSISSFKEFSNIYQLIDQASKGINIFGQTRKIVANELIELSKKEGIEKMQGVFKVLDIISKSNEKSVIVEKSEPWIGSSNKDKLIEVINFINENYQESISLKQMADVACITEQSFCRFFKRRTQKSFSQYIREIRISKAKDLLIQTNNSVIDIAHQCGYNSDSHFCRVFKDQVGKTPLKFKSSALNID